MKKLLCFVMFFAVSAVFSSAEDIKNNIKMVTYFPVPYVAYSTVQVDTAGQLDVGLTQAPAMYLGSAGRVPLNATEVNLKTGELELDNIKYILGGNDLSLGEPSSVPSAGKLAFSKNLRINEMEAGSLVAEKGYDSSAEIPFAMTVNSLSLFGKTFPACEGEKMVWQNLQLQEATQQETYLMCGTPSTPSVCQPTDDGKWERTVSCTDKYGRTDGKQTQKWSTSECKYVDEGGCESQWVMCLSQLKCKGISTTNSGLGGIDGDCGCGDLGEHVGQCGLCGDSFDVHYAVSHHTFPTYEALNAISTHKMGDTSCYPGTQCDDCPAEGTKYIEYSSDGFFGITCCQDSPATRVRRIRVRYAECELRKKTVGCDAYDDCDAYTWSGVGGGETSIGGAVITPMQ